MSDRGARRVLRPQEEALHSLWLRLLRAIEIQIPEVLATLSQVTAEHEQDAELEAAIRSWAIESQLSPSMTSPEFNRWVREEARLTVLWWRSGKQTRSSFRVECGPHEPLEWFLGLFAVGPVGSLDGGQERDDPYSASFTFRWNPFEETTQEVRKRAREEFGEFLPTALDDIASKAGERNGPLAHASVKEEEWHFQAVALNLIYGWPPCEIVDRLRLKGKAAEERVQKAITATRSLMCLRRSHGGRRRF